MKVESSQPVWAFQLERDGKMGGRGLWHAVGNRNSKNPAMLSVPDRLKGLLKATPKADHPAPPHHKKPLKTFDRLGNCYRVTTA